MDTATLLRKVKRTFGDEYGIIINDNDIFDWANEGQLQIIRDTTDNDVYDTRAANTYPVSISDKVTVKRVAINNKALVHSTLQELDLSDINQTSTGSPVYWYVENHQIKLWPTPLSTDTRNVVITYTRTPTALSLVAPYLQFRRNPTSLQYAQIPADLDYDQVGLNFYISLAIDNVSTDMMIARKALLDNSSTASTYQWALVYKGQSGGVGRFALEYSNNTTVRTTASLNYDATTPIVNGQLLRIRVNFVPSTGVVTMYRISSTGVETLFGTDTQATSLPFNMSTVAGNAIWFAGTISPGDWRLYSFRITNDTNLVDTRFEFNGDPDLTILPTVPATPFLVTSGHTMVVVGGAQVYSEDNVLSIPEMWHEDLVRFCIARAHEKNKDHKSAETAWDQYNQRVTSRRNEAQAEDLPQFKGSDPFDYGWDYDSSYG